MILLGSTPTDLHGLYNNEKTNGKQKNQILEFVCQRFPCDFSSRSEVIHYFLNPLEEIEVTDDSTEN